ncbi:MAG: bacillithiol biosynthesis cysteine-adding enzyme BshC [Candidatus Aminicenantes bacterium]|nr:bacillithiol biosynthesis cysteine-adding enzyme BshC [Candidatus Aminicenantes bacterium]
MVIPTNKLPNISSLVYDYYYEYDKVSEFFTGNFRDPTSYTLQTEKVRSRDLPREQLAAILKEQNLSYGCGAQTVGNIQKFIQDKACAVVTGQQVGLFSGPLYTIFKALTAIKLAESLNQTSLGCFVPVFWLASDDHDFEEINHITLLDKENQIEDIQYQGHSANLKTPVSEIVLSKEISNCIQQLNDLTHDSEFKPEILSQLGTAYQPGRSFVEAFAQWMTQLFKSYGLIFIDAAHPALKDLGKDVFYTEIAQNSPSTQCALESSRKLKQKNYSTQIQLHEGILNLFLVEDERHTIQFRDDDFSIKGKPQTFKKDELLQLLEKQPHKFSPNVLLRPLYQDTLLPTVAYVGGLSEVAYFAQMKEVYERFNLPMPIIYPRKSLSLIEKKVDKALKTYSLKVQDIWRNADVKINDIAKEKIPQSLDKAFYITTSHLDKDFIDIKQETLAFEPTLEKSVDLTIGKIHHQICLLEKKILKASKKQNTIMTQRIHLAKSSLYPNQHLQERVFNITPFLIKYSFSLMDRLYQAVDIKHHDHQILKL